MDKIDKMFYKDSMERYKRNSNEKLIMVALHTLINMVDELRPVYKQNNGIIKALTDELKERSSRKDTP